MSTVIFEGSQRWPMANVTATALDDRSSDLYQNVWKVTLDCGVYIIHTKNSIFTTPATNTDLSINPATNTDNPEE